MKIYFARFVIALSLVGLSIALYVASSGGKGEYWLWVFVIGSSLIQTLISKDWRS